MIHAILSSKHYASFSACTTTRVRQPEAAVLTFTNPQLFTKPGSNSPL